MGIRAQHQGCTDKNLTPSIHSILYEVLIVTAPPSFHRSIVPQLSSSTETPLSFQASALPRLLSVLSTYPDNIKMVPAIAIVLIAVASYSIYSIVSGLLKNIAAAKRTGLPYIVARWYKLSFSPANYSPDRSRQFAKYIVACHP
jgi:hypothetical protein